MTLTHQTLGMILPAVFVIGIGASMLSGYWSTEASKIPATYTAGEAVGEYDPADIRGSYSFADIEAAFGVPAETLAQAFGFAAGGNPETILAKDLEDTIGIVDDMEVGTDAVRLFVARYLGLPFEPEDDTALPAQAVTILEESAPLTPEQLADLSARAVDIGASAGAPAPEAGAEDEEERVVRGMTTFGQLAEWGVSETGVADALGTEPGPANLALRDYCTQQGIEFSTVKETLQTLVDRAAGK